MDISFKQQLHEHCLQIVTGKLKALEEKLQDLSASAASETKSSAGDKYETARAMLHMEQDQVKTRKAVLLSQLSVLNRIDPAVKAERIAAGSLARIGDTLYYISIGLGRLRIGATTVFVLSPEAPLGRQLKGLAAGDDVVFQGRRLRINEVV